MSATETRRIDPPRRETSGKLDPTHPALGAGALVFITGLFLTVSPVLAGRSAEEYRPGSVEGILLLPARGIGSSGTRLGVHGSA